MGRATRFLLFISLASSNLVGCSGKPPVGPVPPLPAAQLHQGPLSDFVAAAGLRWLVLAKPRALLAEPSFASNLELLFPSKRLDAFADNSGVDLRTIESACVADYDLGTLYLAQAPASIGKAQQAFVDRLVSEPLFKHPGPGVTQITGIIGLTPESFVGMEGIGFGVAVKDPLLAKIAGAFALGKLKKSPSAFAGAALRELPQKLRATNLGFFAPGPFMGEWAQGAEGLLAQTLAVAVVAQPGEDQRITFEATAVGDYGVDMANVNRRARASFFALAQSGLGKVLGFAEEDVAPEITAESSRVTLRVSMPTARLISGLHAAVAANVAALLELAQKPPVPSRAH